MKKILSIVLACVLCISMCAVFTGCDEKEEKKEDGFKIGAIYINSQKDIAGYTYAHHKGITEAMKQLKLSTDDLYIIDNTAEDYDTVMKAIDTLAGKGCDMIIGISFGYLNAFNDAAAKEEYADIIFSHATGYLSNDKNFNNYFGRIYQARYLAGIPGASEQQYRLCGCLGNRVCRNLQRHQRVYHGRAGCEPRCQGLCQSDQHLGE